MPDGLIEYEEYASHWYLKSDWSMVNETGYCYYYYYYWKKVFIENVYREYLSVTIYDINE